MTEFLIYGGLLAAIPILAIVIILLLANLDAYFMKIALGTTVFIDAGDRLKEVIPNIGGYKMSKTDDLDGRHWVVPEKDEKEREKSFFHNYLKGTLWFQKWLWKKFGVRFISWFWPQVHIHKFDVRKGGRRRVEARNEITPDAPLRSRVVDSPERTMVNSLLFLLPRPVYLEGVELAGDNSRINLLLLPVFRQVIPSLPVYYLKGDFFTLLDAAVEAMMVDFFATYRVEGDPLTYNHWLKLKKAGEESPIEHHLRNFNVSRAYINDLKTAKKTELVDYIKKHHLAPMEGDLTGKIAKVIPSGIIPRFGFALVSFRVVEWEVHSSTVDLAKSLLAKETELHTAEGVRQKASGEGDAIETLAKAQSSRYQKLVSALVDKNVSPDVAARVVETQLRTENIGGKDSKIVTYVEGGASASVMIPGSSTK